LSGLSAARAGMRDHDTPLGSTNAKTPRREQAKTERRTRIVAATRALLREVGSEDLSVKAVAERAEVSLSTLYNLFTSKEDVLASVYHDDLRRFETLIHEADSVDQLERIFDAVDIAADLYGEDPEYYRTIMWRRPGIAGSMRSHHGASRSRRVLMWPRLVSEIIAEKGLVEDASPVVLGASIMHSVSGALSDWIFDSISLTRFRLEAKFGIAIALFPYATAATTLRLRTRLDQLQAQLGAEPRDSRNP
jgi:AcrR family transcriptional regulator